MKKFKKSRTPGRPDPVSVHVGARLRALRTLAGCSQQTLGAAIGVSFQQVQKYERGVNRLSVDMLWRIAQHFAEPIDWFFAHMPPEAGAPPPGEPAALSDGEAALLTAWRRLSPRQQATIADLTASMTHIAPPAMAAE